LLAIHHLNIPLNAKNRNHEKLCGIISWLFAHLVAFLAGNHLTLAAATLKEKSGTSWRK
jgi:hypothetical protein